VRGLTITIHATRSPYTRFPMRDEEMPVTPKDIRDRKFSVALGGYDRDEVHSLLAKVAESHQRTLEPRRWRP
jgi:DivIVA domain-containing protein